MQKFFTILLLFLCLGGYAQTVNISGPVGSGKFGTTVTSLPNGNYVVTDPLYDDGGLVDVGAIYLYNGQTNAVISILKGNSANDSAGNYGITILDNGNFLVLSPGWDNGSLQNAGAITWCNGTTGLSGIINSTNSLVGSSAGELLGYQPIVKLSNGNYVIRDLNWRNGSESFAGAVVWGNASAPLNGTINANNALVGSQTFDHVGSDVVALKNGNYVCISPSWSHGTAFGAGAVTWCNGASGRIGMVSNSNSLVGSHSDDNVGKGGITELANGNYVVKSPYWNQSAGIASQMGAVSWGSGNSGVSGEVSADNSLIQTGPTFVGGPVITVLTNGNYVVSSTGWGKTGLTCQGAATWGNGVTGTSGIISSENSLVGSNAGYPAEIFAVPLSNGNYVVSFSNWESNRGAATWANGLTGITGTISGANSLVGDQAGDNLGNVLPLTNGNYVVSSSTWSNGATKQVGAVSWCNGWTGRTGSISIANAIMGSQTDDKISAGGIVPLPDGNYVISSPDWNNGSIANAGAATLANGSTLITGFVTATNSLVGSQLNDRIGAGGIYSLPSSNYVISSPQWDNGSATDAGAVTFVNANNNETGVVTVQNSLAGLYPNDHVGHVVPLANGNYVVMSLDWNNGAGAVTWGSGIGGVTGVVSAINSLAGSSPDDRVGFDNTIIQLSNGNYIVRSPYWSNGSLVNAGAITWCSGSSGITGFVDKSNSLIGSHANDGSGYGVGYTIDTFTNGYYAVRNMNWDNNAIADAGAITWGNGSSNLTGTITECNSVEGGVTASYLDFMPFKANETYGYLIVGRPAENIVSIYNPMAMTLGSSGDSGSAVIQGFAPVPLQSQASCSILTTVTPNGVHPLAGQLKAKTWVEGSLIRFNNVQYATRHYQITPSADASNTTAKITLYFTQGDFDAFNRDPGNSLHLPVNSDDEAGKAVLRIAKFPGTSNDGSGLPGSYQANASIIDPSDDAIFWDAQNQRWEISFDVSGFSGFFVGVGEKPLPLNLLSFQAQVVNNKTILDWQTTNESNTASFDIERSKDGRYFSKSGNIVSANTPGNHHYRFIDVDPSSLGVPSVFYRLKQLDIDNSFNYSQVLLVAINDQKNTVYLSPNPVIGKANLYISSTATENIKGRIINSSGVAMKQFEWKIFPGSTTHIIDMTMLACGLYYLDLQGPLTHRRLVFFKE